MGTVTKSIGTSGRDYSTLQAWEDALPANMVSDGNAQVGECYNDSEFSAGLTIAGQTTDATNSIKLKCGAGQSFYDNASKTTNPLKYDQANGVGVSVTSINPLMIITSLNVTIEGLQLKNAGQFGTGQGITTLSLTQVVKNCIVEAHTSTTGSDGVIRSTPGKFINCLFISTNGGVGCISLGSNSEYYNCTCVQTNPGGGSGKGFRGNYDAPVALNCASFNFAGGAFGAGFGGSSNYNAADDTSAPGANSVQSLSYAAQFVDTSTGDFRAAPSGGLPNAGTPDATNTNNLDIILQARSLSTPTIGCWEVVSAPPPSGFFSRYYYDMGVNGNV